MTPDLIKKVEGILARLDEVIIADALDNGTIRSGVLAERLIYERADAADCLRALLRAIEGHKDG